MAAEQHGVLNIERAARVVAGLANETILGKRLQFAFLRHLSARWVRLAIGRRVFTHRLDTLLAIRPDRGVLIAANHRSFFDLWVAMLPLFSTTPAPQWLERVSFPVRSEFFYDTPLGLLLNLTLGGCCMYPPLYRDAARGASNEEALARLEAHLARPGSVVGFHPEGRRNRGVDPYRLLPAQPGIGRVVLAARPLVVPVFINGLTNDVVVDVKKTVLDRRSRHTDPVIVVYGPPLDYQAFVGQTPRLALYKRLADHVNEAISACGATERALRASIAAKEHAGDGWMVS